MTISIFKGIISGALLLGAIGLVAHGFYTGKIAWATTTKSIISTCYEPPYHITSIQFNAEIVKFLVLDNRLHLLMPLPITGLSATIVDIKDIMKRVRK
ncbi:hypothetical protein LCGC14_2239490 [marine sediment metagenome]|uniref:Uncharacterized protein n=1 Tax=marine sediment metagenome TaxID=412755 RepID=A0A0F9DTG1_9ZZZZ